MFNMSITKKALMGAVAPVLMMTQTPGVFAGCNCQSGHHSSGYHGSPYVMSAPTMSMPYHPPMMARSHAYRAPSYSSIGTVFAPPGTLGRTYRQVSRPIPDDKHPRIGMVEVRGVPTDAKLAVRDMTGFRDKTGVWVLESEEPLPPGVPHVYAIKVVRETLDGQMQSDSRVIRLIPGRIVGLQY